MIWQNTKVRIAIIASLVLLAIIAYRIYGNIQANNERANRVSQGQNIAVATSFPQRQSITPVMRFAGSLDPVWQADVAAKIDGRVEKVYVNEGDKVTAGTVLAHLEQTEQTANLLSAKGSLMDAQTTLERAERELQRYQALYEKGAVSEQTVDNYRFARNNAQGKLSEAQGVWDNMQDKLSGASVTAPQDGIISKRYYQEGYYAKVGTALFNIADISELTAKINIPEGQISNIAVGGLADITVPAYPDDKFSGMITRISPVADMPARTFAAEVTVDNSAGKLRGGVYANVVITAEPKENALVIPMSAIVMREDQRTVFVVDDDGAAQRGRHGFGNRARHDVRAATGRVALHPFEWLGVLGVGQGEGGGQCRPGKGGEEVFALHGVVSVVLSKNEGKALAPHRLRGAGAVG